MVLDLAGTTVQGAGDVAAVFTETLAEHGVEITGEQLAAVRGANKREAISRLLPDSADRAERAQVVYDSFRNRLVQHFAAGRIEPVDGAAALIDWLRSRATKVALNTGFDREVTTVLLDRLGWSRIADAVICGDDVPLGRPAPYMIFRAMETTAVMSVHSVCNAGDTTLDLQAGANAGVKWNVGVTSGAHPRERLERLPHTHLIASIADLQEILA